MREGSPLLARHLLPLRSGGLWSITGKPRPEQRGSSPRAGSLGFQPQPPGPQVLSSALRALALGAACPGWERLPGMGQGGRCCFWHLELALPDTSRLSLCRHVAAPAWASSPAPGQLGISGPRKGAGEACAETGPGWCWEHRVPVASQVPTCWGLGLAASGAEPCHHFCPPGSGCEGRWGHGLELKSPCGVPSSIRALAFRSQFPLASLSLGVALYFCRPVS